MRYYKRYRMEYDLTGRVLLDATLPGGFQWVPWSSGLEQRHALTKLESFAEEVDSTVFESLGSFHGCLKLMQMITEQPGFLPQATWLISEIRDEAGYHDCGTIQAITVAPQLANIQNVGVIPSHRGVGLGRALVIRCLAGCRESGMHRVALEVTANNTPAIELYRKVGFQITRTMYRSVDSPVDEAGLLR